MSRNKPLPSLLTRCKKPNFLLLIDQPCDSSVDQSDEKKNLFMQEFLLNGFEFQNHYVGSSACSPSKMTLYTGQYPSLHGVRQTRGFHQKQFNATVPIMEDYFRKAGYQTFWKELAADQVSDEANQRMASLNKEDMVCAKDVVGLLEKLDQEEMEGSHQWVIFSSFRSEQRYGEMMNVFQTLKKTAVYQDTIVLYTSMIGQSEELDARNRNNVYEKYIHVPMMIHSPALFHGQKRTGMLTSHVDLLPTMLGLAGIDEEEVQTLLSMDDAEVRPLVGRDLTPLLLGRKRFYRANEPLYFMTDEEESLDLKDAGEFVETVVQPNHIEAVMATLRTGEENEQEVWKYARYFDDPQFWRVPGVSDVIVTQEKDVSTEAEKPLSKWVTLTKTSPAPDEFELFNLTRDPLEKKNLITAEFETSETKAIGKVLSLILEEQHRQKRLISKRNDTGNVAI
ncbi:sulfatase-like hydrolase/transferase [Guptibacillus hwajinpoensis]|uniref:sulfatase-like hydrolase/transferase n=1 Tax=Guptibacillus hwajinpoensis TaxID=208199 RepID=UPI001CD2336B|nr:sulfatase-like hydrolase/transferase [Pseudalkalibacillus hwajinpoensis]MCA0993755.1 sulfatase-like hydrolase/transferase [Pseudalkalibacillus hwajinpoensis]